MEIAKNTSEKYQKIIEAATKVFAKKGFYNSKVADIAAEADVADGTIYLYFKNKDDILISIFEHSMDVFISTVKKTLETSLDPAEKLELFIKLHLELVEKNPYVAQVLQIELRQSSKFMKEYDVRKFKAYLEIISGIIQQGQSKGVFNNNLDLHILSRAIFGAVDEMALEWILLKKKKYTLEACAKQLANVFINGLKKCSEEENKKHDVIASEPRWRAWQSRKEII